MTTVLAEPTTAHERVMRGVELLDSRISEWWFEVGRLDMARVDQCILGQLKGSYGAGLDWLGLDYGYPYGFGASPGTFTEMMNEYKQLTCIWRHVINQRVKG